MEQLLREEIENGTYPVGSMIPTEKELIEMFDVSRTTVRQAISALVQDGLLYRSKSKGTFVAKPKVHQRFIHSILSYNEDVENDGRIPSTVVLDLKVMPLPLELTPEAGELGDTVIYLYRKRLVDGEPFVRVETYLPYEPCKFVLEHDFSKESLYNVLSEKKETHISRVLRTCEVFTATVEDAALLDIERGQPIHFFESKGYNSAGRLLEYSLARYRGDRSKFSVEISRVYGPGILLCRAQCRSNPAVRGPAGLPFLRRFPHFVPVFRIFSSIIM